MSIFSSSPFFSPTYYVSHCQIERGREKGIFLTDGLKKVK